MAMSWVACRWCCSTRLWAPISAGTSRLAAFYKDQICNYVGGMLPFARTAPERRANADPRLSPEERYSTQDGYVNAVRRAVARAMQEGFLLETNGAALVKAAQDSAVLR